MGQERATKLLKQWSDKKWKVILRIVFGAKFIMTFTEGKLEQPYGKDLGLFDYIASGGVHTMVVPMNFTCWERGETDDVEGLIFSYPDGENSMILSRSKENKPILIAQLSKWLN
jgi:hypothetical protein